jgi:hypothetical protein
MKKCIKIKMIAPVIINGVTYPARIVKFIDENGNRLDDSLEICLSSRHDAWTDVPSSLFPERFYRESLFARPETGWIIEI